MSSKSPLIVLIVLMVTACSWAKAVIKIVPLHGEAQVEFFPRIDSFANISWSIPIFPNHGDNSYEVILDEANVEVALLINKIGIELYVQDSDSVIVYFDTKSDSVYFKGSNAILHTIYNSAKQHYEVYEHAFSYSVLDLRAIDVIDAEIVEQVDRFIDEFENLYPPAYLNSSCLTIYKTSEIIKMLGWIEEGYPIQDQKQGIISKLLSHLSLDAFDINKSLYNLNYYDLYYSLFHENSFTNSDNYIYRNYGYFKAAPHPLRQYLIQSCFISTYKATNGQYLEWCQIYTGILPDISNRIYFDFFNDLELCSD